MEDTFKAMNSSVNDKPGKIKSFKNIDKHGLQGMDFMSVNL